MFFEKDGKKIIYPGYTGKSSSKGMSLMTDELDISEPIQIADGVHWIGFEDTSAGFHCNPYLLVDGGEAILFDPGSVQHFPIVLSKLVKLISLDQISHIIVTHQDPDLCGAIPKFEELIYGVGSSLKIATHTRASVLVAHYGVRSEFYCVDQNGWRLTMRSGRELKFIFTPYMHFPGSFMTFDDKTGILFSGDVFGALSFDWSIYANEYYMEAMKAFHENYMPSSEIVNSGMRKLEKLDIKMIAPQHGSIINKDVASYIETLKNLECGEFMSESEE